MSLDSQLLSALRTAAADSVSAIDLAQKLGVTRSAIEARVQELRSLGYDIQAGPHFGYRLVAAPDLLLADDLLAQLGKTKVIGRTIDVFQQTTSTNDVIDRLARDQVKEGAVVFAESQTKGRGRLGRNWLSPAAKGLWFSILLRPALRPDETTRLTVASATALRRAIAQQTMLDPKIKWPNDILINGLKVAGILTELHAELDQVKYVILGIGVDVNLDRDDFPPELQQVATSLKLQSTSPIPRPELAACILRELDVEYDRLGSGGFTTIADEWARHSATIGQNVRIQLGDRRIQGHAESLAEDGALLLRTEHGRLERILGGDVLLEP
jgi:BirA family biotin operon repressor/biotin-[acetyl-CoA-carboxylase] ligase